IPRSCFLELLPKSFDRCSASFPAFGVVDELRLDDEGDLPLGFPLIVLSSTDFLIRRVNSGDTFTQRLIGPAHDLRRFRFRCKTPDCIPPFRSRRHKISPVLGSGGNSGKVRPEDFADLTVGLLAIYNVAIKTRVFA